MANTSISNSSSRARPSSDPPPDKQLPQRRIWRAKCRRCAVAAYIPFLPKFSSRAAVARRTSSAPAFCALWRHPPQALRAHPRPNPCEGAQVCPLAGMPPPLRGRTCARRQTFPKSVQKSSVCPRFYRGALMQSADNQHDDAFCFPRLQPGQGPACKEAILAQQGKQSVRRTDGAVGS